MLLGVGDDRRGRAEASDDRRPLTSCRFDGLATKCMCNGCKVGAGPKLEFGGERDVEAAGDPRSIAIAVLGGLGRGREVEAPQHQASPRQGLGSGRGKGREGTFKGSQRRDGVAAFNLGNDGDPQQVRRDDQSRWRVGSDLKTRTKFDGRLEHAASVPRDRGLLVTGASDARDRLVVPMPPASGQALGVLRLTKPLGPLPKSIISALFDLITDLPAVTGEPDDSHTACAPVKVKLGHDACGITFEQDTTVRRFPYKLLVRLIEPRTTTVRRVQMTARLPAWAPALLGPRTTSHYVERLPVEKPLSVDGFRDELIGVQGNVIHSDRTVPMAGTLGLGYVLNLAQVWKFQGLTLGNLLYSLPLAPGEQQRIAISERVATASVMDTESLTMQEAQYAKMTQDASTQAIFRSAFEESVNATSEYSNEARSRSWGVGGGVGFAFGPLVAGLGAVGGGGKSSNHGSTRSSLDGSRRYSSTAAEEMHRSVEQQAAASRQAHRTSVRLATETDSETVTTKVITNHNKAHALTMQYWEVLRKFTSTTEVEGVTLVCFVPLDVVRFLPAGQPLELLSTAGVDTRSEVLARYALLHRHSDVLRLRIPRQHREGLRILDEFAANPRAKAQVVGPAAKTLTFSLRGRFVAYEQVSVRVILRGGRQIGPVRLDSPLTSLESKLFATRSELLAHLKQLRKDGDFVTMTGGIAIPESVDPSAIVAFEIRRRFDELRYELDPAKHWVVTLGAAVWKELGLETSVRMTAAQLEAQIGGPEIRTFRARINGDNIAADTLTQAIELPSSGWPIPALEINPSLSFRDLMKVERTLQHVVRNTVSYSKAVWSSLTPEERVIMLEGYTIGLPDTGLTPEQLNDPSQHVPLLNCIGNQVLGYYGNCMIMPFTIPAALAVDLAGDMAAGEAGEVSSGEPLTTGAVQDALTQFHRAAFSPPESHFTLPTRGVLGEAVLGHCSAAEKIDLTRFWNWQDSPAPEATAIDNVGLRSNNLSHLQAPATLAATPNIVNHVGSDGGGQQLGALAQALANVAGSTQSFSTDYLGHNVLTTLGGKTIESAEAARKDALAAATSMAEKALGVGLDVSKTKANAAPTSTVDDAVKDLKENAASYLLAAGNTNDPVKAILYASQKLAALTKGEGLPADKAELLLSAYHKMDGDSLSMASAAWLKALGLPSNTSGE